MKRKLTPKQKARLYKRFECIMANLRRLERVRDVPQYRKNYQGLMVQFIDVQMKVQGL